MQGRMVQLNIDTPLDIPNGKGINIGCLCYIYYQVKTAVLVYSSLFAW